MFITWERRKNRAYAKLRQTCWDYGRKKPFVEVWYLGSTLEEARQKLLQILKSGQLAVPAKEQMALFEQLEARMPEDLKPKVDRSLEATKRLLRQRLTVHKGGPVREILQEALEKLEKEALGNGKAGTR